MWGTIIHVGYLPEFSFKVKQLIRKEITPSLVSNNEEGTNQYFLDDIKNILYLEDVITDSDNAIILAMENEGITYCEF